MSDKKKEYHADTPTKIGAHKTIECKPFDPIKSFIRDPSGVYVLIRVNFEVLKIELGVCDKNNTMLIVFRGSNAQEIYHTLLSYEKRYKKNWFREKTHLTYIGKELKKAEFALVTGNNAYYQE